MNAPPDFLWGVLTVGAAPAALILLLMLLLPGPRSRGPGWDRVRWLALLSLLGAAVLLGLGVAVATALDPAQALVAAVDRTQRLSRLFLILAPLTSAAVFLVLFIRRWRQGPTPAGADPAPTGVNTQP